MLCCPNGYDEVCLNYWFVHVTLCFLEFFSECVEICLRMVFMSDKVIDYPMELILNVKI